jgi:ribonuclease P protein component
MVPGSNRLRRRADFTNVVRRGRRSAASLVVLHLLDDSSATSPLVGFVVSRSVGQATVRNRVRRRLRAMLCARINRLPAGTRLVVRATPGAATARFDELAAALDVALDRLVPDPVGSR